MAGIQHINSMKNLTEFAKNFDAKELEKWIINSLANEGGRIIKEAYESSGFKNRTGNLHDSYVSAVFYNGRLQKDTVRYVGTEMSSTYREYSNSMEGGEVEATKGREEADKFLAKYQFSKGRQGGIVLVIAAAMFYSTIVEKRGYQVLSQVQWELDRIANRGYSVSKFNTHIKPEFITTNTIYREEGRGKMQTFI
jgi:hypothetical protein